MTEPRERPPAVAVLCAVHNGEDFLDEMVESIRAQTLDDLELIIVDDASTDSTPDVLARFAAKDPRIRVICNDRQLGRAAARNVALAAVRAPLMVVHDADDLSRPERLEKQKAYMDGHADVAVLAAPLTMVDEGGSFVANKPIADTAEEIRRQMRQRNCFSHCAGMFRTAAVREIGGYREGFTYVEDFDMLSRLVERNEIGVLHEPFYLYRVVDSGASIGLLPEQRREVINLVRQFAAERAATGSDSYEQYVAEGRIPEFPRELPSGRRKRYYYILAKIAVGQGEYRTMLKYTGRGLRDSPALLPKFAYLVFAAGVRMILDATGLLAGFERRFRATSTEKRG
jgi:glycosyltransferase involved in cell wall biosynthesis